jgi:hypothetical protein
MTIRLVSALALAVAAPFSAQAQVSVANSHARGQEVALAPGQNPDEVVCRTVEPPVGSRLGARRTCATRAQWQELANRRAQARQTLEIAQQQRPCTVGAGGATCR